MRVALFIPLLALLACTRAPSPPTLVTVLDSPPTTLNPRIAVDAYSQRLNALLLRGLTRLDADLEPRPDLAESWKNEGTNWRFRLKADARDHEGQPITPSRVAACLESYRIGKPVSIFRGAFPGWSGTKAEGPDVVVLMTKPDPYFLRNVVLLRYFRVAGESEPCVDPGSDGRIIGSGPYRPDTDRLAPEKELTLIPAEDQKAPRIRFEFVRDDNTKLLKLLRGEVDFLQNMMSPAKTRWVIGHAGDRFQVLERAGVNVSYLAFNLRDPALSKPEVRRAIAAAIPRETIVHGRLGRLGSVAGSFLAPSLPESAQSEYAYDPDRARAWLAQAGFPHGLTLHFKTTPVTESIETALILQSELRKIGIELQLDVVEPAVFYAAIQKHAFQLYAGRWIGVGDGSILYDTLHTGEHDNRVGYSDPEMDRLLEAAASELDLTRRATSHDPGPAQDGRAICPIFHSGIGITI